jgi:hypothetical protein
MTDQTVAPVDDEQAQSPPIYQIRLDLKNARPPIWRRLLIPSDTRIDVVHQIIQVAMGWTDSHLHVFTSMGFEIGDVSFNDFNMAMVDETQVTLDKLLQKIGDRLDYEYDFGDGWAHILKLEKILPPDPDADYPICLTGRRACPPEDIGGIWGYADFLEALADEGHPDHEYYVEWYGDAFDAEHFDPEATTEALQTLVTEYADDDHVPLHPLTLLRWQMLSHELVAQIPAHPPSDLVGPPDAAQERWARRIRRAKSASELLDLLPLDHPSLIAEWEKHWEAFSPKIARLAAQRLAKPSLWPVEGQRWAQERLVCALHRLGPPAVQPLIGVFETLDDYGKALACLALGQLGARDAGDAFWQYYVRAYETPETGWFLAPLWALVDIADPRAADAVAAALEDDWDFDELAAIAGRAGDHRALLPLLGWMMLYSEEPPAAVTGAATLVAHRMGREAILEALSNLPNSGGPDSPEISPAILADSLLKISVEQAEEGIAGYFTPVTVESLMAEIMDSDIAFDDPFFDPEWLLGTEEDEDIIEIEPQTPIGPAIVPLSLLTPRRPEGRRGPGLDRNDPCWCGSGRKYKHCHWREDQHKDIPRTA